IALEMLEDAEHAARACEAARAAGLPVWLGGSCRLRADRTLGAFDFPATPFAAVLDALLPFAPGRVNVMHRPPHASDGALAGIGARRRGLHGAYPELEEVATPPSDLAALARGWLEAGARIVGGCCGATPEHVRALRAARDAWEGSAR